MGKLAIAIDLGTSGFRAQAIDLRDARTVSTAISTRHPLPGANVIDHLHFAVEFGVDRARDIVVEGVNQLIAQLRLPAGGIEQIERLAVCGNPTQLSLFQAMEIRDLAYAGSRKLAALGVCVPDRAAALRCAADFPGLALPAACQVIIPPAVSDEIGADTLALITQSGLLDAGEASAVGDAAGAAGTAGDTTAIAIDYGTNAEMALVHRGRVYTGSAAAGPALEGQHLACGALAQPGTICDLMPVGSAHRLRVLDAQMHAVPGALIDMQTGASDATGALPMALTGTGVIAALDQAIGAGLIELPHIRTADRRLHFSDTLYLDEADLAQAGKAIGALRAGYFSLCVAAGIDPTDIRSAYLAGASGSYMDARKGGRLGLIPPCVDTVRQIGNTSLAMARELALAPEKLSALDALATSIRPSHQLFATSKTFARVFLLELSYWTEGMPMSTYRSLLRRYRLPDLPPPRPVARILRPPPRHGTDAGAPGAIGDLGDLGARGLRLLEHIGRVVALPVAGCSACLYCAEHCPGQALAVDAHTVPVTIRLDYARCNGVACRHCETDCPSSVFRLDAFFVSDRPPADAQHDAGG